MLNYLVLFPFTFMLGGDTHRCTTDGIFMWSGS